MITPVVDNILAVTIFRRQAVAAMETMIGSGTAAFAMVIASLRCTALRATTIVLSVLDMLVAWIATLITLVALVWAMILRIDNR
jgi:hypothetical protein